MRRTASSNTRVYCSSMPGTDFSDPAAFASVGMTITGMPALNAIPAVVAAEPGCVTSADLPLRAFAGRFSVD